jgi:2-oxo-4-hydroxy-4-carboxy-5-ureidoimidazoline decarboxylase
VTVEELNALPEARFVEEAMRCCGSTRWAKGMAARRPFAGREALLAAADAEWSGTTEADWREAMTHHPRIGADVSKLREKYKATASWSSQEQQGVSAADEETLQGLARGNTEYEQRFGFIFLVCATGKSAKEMLELLRARLPNPPDVELRVAAGEQAKITRIRLEKLLT